MDKKRQIIIKVLLITIFVLLFIGTLVRFNIISFDNNNLPETIGLNKIEFGIKKYDTYNLVATIYPFNSFKGQIEWKSSDTDIIEVNDSGLIYGKNEGIANVIARIPYNNMNITCTVHVSSEDIPIESFSLTTDEINLLLGSTYDINYQVYPLNSNDRSIYYVSSDDSIISVDNLGHIVTKSVGTAYVKAYSLNGDKSILKVNVIKDLENNKINISSNNVNLNVGTKTRIKTGNKDVYFESLNPNIVRINNGMLEALNVGDTKVLAKLPNNDLKIIDVQVTKHKVNVDKIQIREKELELYVNDSYELSIGILPLNATNKNFVYSSNDEGVATVEDGIVKGIGIGTTKITVRDEYSNNSDTITVRVYEDPDEIELSNLEFAEDEITMYVDSSMMLDYSIDPINADKNLNWLSSDNDVVIVEDGVVRAISEGEATIYVNKGDISRKVDIKVIPVPLLSMNTSDVNVHLSPGATYSLNLGFVPNNATDINLEYNSLNNNVATIENGVIKAIDVGNTVIEIKSNNIILEINVEVR